MEREKQLRINELAKKAKTSGLTPEEAAEQKQLREEYISEYLASLRSQLDHTVLQEPDGTRIPLSDLRKK